MPMISISAGAEMPEDLTISKDETQTIRNDILALKEPYLMVSTLFFLHEKTVEEIAVLLERPPKTVHTQLYRAKQVLRTQIEGRSHNEII